MNRTKNVTIILIIVSVISLLLASSFAAKRKAEVEKRLTMETQVNKLIAEKNALEAGLKDSVSKLQETQLTNENLKTALAQEQLKNQSLTAELEKVSQIKAALEEKLSQPAVSAATSTGKKKR